MPIKIIVADDDAMIRESLKIIIGMDKDFDIKECVENGFEAVNCCKKMMLMWLYWTSVCQL